MRQWKTNQFMTFLTYKHSGTEIRLLTKCTAAFKSGCLLVILWRRFKAGKCLWRKLKQRRYDDWCLFYPVQKKTCHLGLSKEKEDQSRGNRKWFCLHWIKVHLANMESNSFSSHCILEWVIVFLCGQVNFLFSFSFTSIEASNATWQWVKEIGAKNKTNKESRFGGK